MKYSSKGLMRHIDYLPSFTMRVWLITVRSLINAPGQILARFFTKKCLVSVYVIFWHIGYKLIDYVWFRSELRFFLQKGRWHKISEGRVLKNIR